MGFGVLARLTPVALRRWCTAAAAIGCGAFAVSINREVGLAYVADTRECYSARLGNGELCLRWDRLCEPALRTSEEGVALINGQYSECRLAWRPYHARSTYGGPGDSEG